VAGVAACRLLPFESRELWFALGAFMSLALLAGVLKLRSWIVVTCLLSAVLAAGALTAVRHARGAPPEIDFNSREVMVLEGCVVEPSVFAEDREQFTLELDRDARARVSLYIKEGQMPPVLSYGQRVAVEAGLRTPRNFGNPGAFDYAGYLARSHIYWSASVPSGGEVKVLPGECGSGLWRGVFALRTAALERIDRLYPGDTYSAAMMQAILIGETAKMQRVWTENFRRSGTYHALVISGLHVTVLAATLLFLLRLLLVPELWRLLIATASTWLYALVSGWQPPVVRSAGGFTLFLACRYFYRRGRVLNVLAAVALVILAFDPESLFDPSFQLSFLSIAVIGALASPILEGFTRPWARGARGLHETGRDLHIDDPRVAQFRVELRLIAETLSLWTRLPQRWILRVWGALLRFVFGALNLALISAVVQVGLALPMILYFHRVSLSGLTANTVIVPLMETLVPVGFVAIFTGWHWVAWVAGLLLRWSEAVARWHVAWEPNYRMPDPPLWLCIAFCAALLGAAFVVRARWWWRLAASAAVLSLFTVLIGHPFAAHTSFGRLELTMVDVGQGECLMLTLPSGGTMLVDGGGFPSLGKRKPRMDIGEDVVSPYLWRRGIQRVEVIALTHGHSDHSGGVPALIENFRPRELWTGVMPSDDPDWQPVRDKALAFGVRIVPLVAGERRALGGVRFDVLTPVAGQDSRERAHNNDSLTMMARFGAHTFLLTGDIEKQVEWDLLDHNEVPRVDVLKVAHHGSRTSTVPEFLERAHPTFALISAGYENMYRLPSPDVVQRLTEAHAGVLRTDEWGLVRVVSNGKRLWAETARTGLEGETP
jgi:competence protein ComEC